MLQMHLLTDVFSLAQFAEGASGPEELLCMGFFQARASSPQGEGLRLHACPPLLLPYLYEQIARGLLSPLEQQPLFVLSQAHVAAPSAPAVPLGATKAQLKMNAIVRSVSEQITNQLRRWLLVPLTQATGEMTLSEQKNHLSTRLEWARHLAERLGYRRLVVVTDLDMGSFFLSQTSASSVEFTRFFLKWLADYWCLPGTLGVFAVSQPQSRLLTQVASEISLRNKHPQKSFGSEIDDPFRRASCSFRLWGSCGNALVKV